MHNPFKYFKTSPEIIRLAVMMYIRFPLSLRNVEDLLHERGIDITHATVRFWWNRFGPMAGFGGRFARLTVPYPVPARLWTLASNARPIALSPVTVHRVPSVAR